MAFARRGRSVARTFVTGGKTVGRGAEGRLCASVRWDWNWRGPRNEELAQVVPKEGGVGRRQGFLVGGQG